MRNRGIQPASGLRFLQVTNLSQWKLAVSVHFRVPRLLNGEAVWDAAVRSTAEGVSCVSQKEPPQNPDFLTQIQRRSVLVRTVHKEEYTDESELCSHPVLS